MLRPKYSLENHGLAMLFAELSAEIEGVGDAFCRSIRLRTKAVQCFLPGSQRIIAGGGGTACVSGRDSRVCG